MKRLSLALFLLAACGGKSSPKTTKTVEQEQPAGPTCQELGDHTAADMTKDLPEGVPADAPARFGVMIAKICTDDHWPADVIQCGMTAEHPREECSPKLDETQRKHIDAAQQAFTMELMAAMHPPIGVKSCDELIVSVDRLVACPAAVEAMGEQLQQIAAGMAQLYTVPEDQKAGLEATCAEGIPAIHELVEAHGC
jgi:hypothetical protein